MGPMASKPSPEVRQVAGGEVVIGFDGHQFFERGFVAVNVGKDEELHGHFSPQVGV